MRYETKNWNQESGTRKQEKIKEKRIKKKVAP